MAAAHGTLALVGSGEFLAPIEPLDRQLLGRLNETPRIVVLPTASAPDGPGVPERWGRMGVEHFARLGAGAEPVMLLTRADAESTSLARKIAAANFVYFSGGKPPYLLKTLQGTACWRAIEAVFAAGGVVVGCSAGAMALASYLLSWPRLWRMEPALDLAASDFAVIPHFDEVPRWMVGIISRLAADRTVVGIEGSTALVGAGHDWLVCGRGSATVFAGKQKAASYRAGDKVSLSASRFAADE